MRNSDHIADSEEILPVEARFGPWGFPELGSSLALSGVTSRNASDTA